MNRLGLLIAFTALAAAGRMLLLALPNVALTFFVVAVAALAYGPRFGAAVGGLAMLVTNAMLSGLAPGPLLATGVVAAMGAGLGALRPLRFPGPRRTLAGMAAAALLGAGLQLAFSVAVDALSWLVFTGGAAATLPLLYASLAGGLVFNVPAAVFQAALFAGALQPVVHALRAAGLAEDPGPGPRRRALREVVIAEA